MAKKLEDSLKCAISFLSCFLPLFFFFKEFYLTQFSSKQVNLNTLIVDNAIKFNYRAQHKFKMLGWCYVTIVSVNKRFFPFCHRSIEKFLKTGNNRLIKIMVK